MVGVALTESGATSVGNAVHRRLWPGGSVRLDPATIRPTRFCPKADSRLANQEYSMQVSYFDALRNGHGQPESGRVGGHMVNPSGPAMCRKGRC